VSLVVLALLAACAQEREPAMAVTVNLEPGTLSSHVRVRATAGDARRETRCMPVDGQRVLDVAIVQGELPDAIMLSAEGFSDDACATATEPQENAVPIERRFRKGLIVDAALTLRQVRPTIETDCDNGLDDDGDGQLDCVDVDCTARACSTGNACVAGQVCSNGACQGGQQVTCSTPPSGCFMGGGLCVVDAGCRYLPMPGTGCDDLNDCTTMDRCDTSGSCVGQVRSCATPPPGQCWQAMGLCVPDAGCRYDAKLGGACDDGENCTVDDRCDGDAGCTGTAVSCPALECAVPTGSCTADGGCLYAPRDAGIGCGDGGACNVQGSCLPPFPFVPSNVAINDIPTPSSGKVTFDCGTTVIDTGSSGVPSVTNYCPTAPRFGSASITQPGGLSTVVLAFEDLEVAGGSTLSIVGVRPAIIVSMRDILVLGTISVSAGAQACAGNGAGGNGGGTLYKSGGGGGGFVTAGAAGGAAAVAAGTGGVVNMGTQLRGGCPGGLGGGNGQRLASGGGALQLVARQTLTIAGIVTAPGAGGEGGATAEGGNGGGSGGDLLFEAQQVIASSGAIACNGGAGGQADTSVDGQPGQASAMVARGGDNTFSGGAGGDGAAGSTAAEVGENAGIANSAGGGGGGVGRIRINVTNGCSIGPQVTLSPAPTSNKPDAGCP
jgi:hypothetical protein